MIKKNRMITYDTYEDALDAIAEYNSKPYILDYEEYSGPDYLVVSTAAADWVSDGRNSDMSNYDWTEAECTCGECNECIKMMERQDAHYLRTDAEALAEAHKNNN